MALGHLSINKNSSSRQSTIKLNVYWDSSIMSTVKFSHGSQICLEKPWELWNTLQKDKSGQVIAYLWLICWKGLTFPNCSISPDADRRKTQGWRWILLKLQIQTTSSPSLHLCNSFVLFLYLPDQPSLPKTQGHPCLATTFQYLCHHKI